MKKVLAISAAIILLIGSTASAQNLLAKFSSTEIKTYSLSFNKIVIEDDIDVILVESPERNIQVEGRREDANNVEWKVKNGTLYLASKGGSLKNRVLVTLEVSDLRQIEINGASEVKSQGNLSSSSLYIYMNGLGLVNIANQGKMTLIKAEGVGLDVKKKTANVYIPASGS